jgi:hypothetical protein
MIRRREFIAGIGGAAAWPPSFGVELSPYDTRDAVEIERAFTAMGRGILAA